MRRQIIFGTEKNTTTTLSSTNQIDSQENCLFQDFDMIQCKYNGNLVCLWQPIHNKRIRAHIAFGYVVVLRHFRNSKSSDFYGGFERFVETKKSTKINTFRFFRIHVHGLNKAVSVYSRHTVWLCGVFTISFSVTFMMICCCISHRNSGVTFHSISLIWRIVKKIHSRWKFQGNIWLHGKFILFQQVQSYIF